VKTVIVLRVLVLLLMRDCYARSKLQTTAVIRVAEESAIVWTYDLDDDVRELPASLTNVGHRSTCGASGQRYGRMRGNKSCEMTYDVKDTVEILAT
jgi:hypothetical protein